MKAFNQWQSNISSQWDLKTLWFINLWFNAGFFQSVVLSHYKWQNNKLWSLQSPAQNACISASFIYQYDLYIQILPVLQVSCQRITAGLLIDSIFTSLFLVLPFLSLHKQFTYYIFLSHNFSIKYEKHNWYQSNSTE